MKVLENGDYQLDDGTIVGKDDVAKLGRKAPRKESKDAEKDTLQEGECSGVMQLND